MAKVVITIEDVNEEGGGIQVKTEFDPPIENIKDFTSLLNLPDSQQMGMVGVIAIHEKMEARGCKNGGMVVKVEL